MVNEYTVLREDVVESIIVAGDDYSSDGFEVVEYSDETLCQPDMLYNKENGLFYDDK